MPLRLKTTCAPNPRIDPLVEGLVTVPNVEFDWDLKPVPMLFLNNIKFDNLELYLQEMKPATAKEQKHGKRRSK